MSTPRADRYFPSLAEETNHNTNVYMFAEDIHLGIMPIGSRRHSEIDYEVKIEGSSDSVTAVITILNSLAKYERYRPEELLSDVVGRVAGRLAWNGRAVHEITRDQERDGVYLLQGFTTQRLFYVFGKYIQVIPKADRRLWKKAYVILPEKNVWDITIPRVLGGYRAYRTILRNLTRFQGTGPSFLLQDLSGQGWPAHYDFQRYIREAEFFETKITSLWGWNRRDSSERNWTEFYWSYRTLRFRLAQAYLREHIVDELNRLFRRLGIQAEIVVKGLPTPSEISAIQQRMLEGDISFKEAFDNCSVN